MKVSRLGKLKVNNFKSLVDFEISFEKFTCLIGLNGSGKSTLIQFVDFLSQLAIGDVDQWLEERQWKEMDVASKLVDSSVLSFSIDLLNESGTKIGVWSGDYEISKKQCVCESLSIGTTQLDHDGKFFSVRCPDELSFSLNGEPIDRTSKSAGIPITFIYTGSLLSALQDNWLTPHLIDAKKFIAEIKSLDLLAPNLLRQRTRESSGSMGRGGQNLASFFFELPEEKKRAVTQQLQKAYPQLVEFKIASLQSGWKQVEVVEAYQCANQLFPSMKTEARHINDGMLRIVAILTELQSENGFLLFDEIENGINPELVEFVVDNLVRANQQVVATTHSPMILNYLDDDIARSGVVYLYKTADGATKSIPFFSIPSVSGKLEVMGPGEAFVDTNLSILADEILSLSTR